MQKRTIIELEEFERNILKEKEMEQQKLKEVDIMDAQIRFDRVKFIYDTNIDLLDIIKNQFKDTYKQAFEIYRERTCPQI